METEGPLDAVTVKRKTSRADIDRLPDLGKVADGDTLVCRRCQALLSFKLQGEQYYVATLGSIRVAP